MEKKLNYRMETELCQENGTFHGRPVQLVATPPVRHAFFGLLSSPLSVASMVSRFSYSS